MRRGPVTSVIFIAALLLIAVGASDRLSAATEASLYKKAETARQHLENDSKAQGLRHEWLNVIQLYEAVLRYYPTGPSAEASLMHVGDLYIGLYKRSRRSSDVDQAVDRYRKLVKEFPKRPVAAQAQFKIGRAYYEYKHDLDRAYVELLKVELNHPREKDEVNRARQLMASISGSSKYQNLKTPSPETPAPSTAKGKSAAMATAAAGTPDRAVDVPGHLSVVGGLRHWHNPTYSRVALDLTREVRFKDHLLRPDPKLEKPMRLFLDLSPARLSPGVSEEVSIGDGLLKRARIGQYDQDTVRLVLDIQNITNYRIFALTNPARLVVDVTSEEKEEEPVQTSVAKNVPSKNTVAASEKTPPARKENPKGPLKDLRDTAKKRKKLPRGRVKGNLDQSSLARQLGLGVNRVVIDPGHGGKDNGATGVSGLREKNLVLKAAKMLAGKLKKQGLEVILTRSGDTFIPLEERTAQANTKTADLFISIHANAHRSSKVHGLETYFLNIATDEESMRVAAMENATTRKSMSDLQMILSDLMLNSKIAESGRLASRVHRSMAYQVKKSYKGVRDLGIKKAPFYVLIGANMPSILVELGFLSNKTEERRLRSDQYLEHLTDGIAEGVRAYNLSIKKGG